MDRTEILNWLREQDESRLEELWRQADQVRRSNVGDAVHLRGLIEVSNYCTSQCGYCGVRAGNRDVFRYRMTAEEVLECTHRAARFGYGTIVLQGGEDPFLDAEWVADLVRRIKMVAGQAVTLSLGERTPDELKLWREAGADRYLLRFETSDPLLLARIKEIDIVEADWKGDSSFTTQRMSVLGTLKELGYETGSGVMIGIPGQSWESLAQDIELFRTLDLDMVGVGPYIPHPDTPMGRGEGPEKLDPANQVTNDVLSTCKVVALTRLVCPWANLPATTALATLDPTGGRELGLTRGANVVMPNLTPPKYRQAYEIYPGKAPAQDTEGVEQHDALLGRLKAIGRFPGTGQGNVNRSLKMGEVS